MEKLFVKFHREDTDTSASFYFKKQAKFGIFYPAFEVDGGLYQNSFNETKVAPLSFTCAHFITDVLDNSSNSTKINISFSASEINHSVLPENEDNEVIKANNYKTNLITKIKMPMTEPITTIPMTHYCSRASWSYKLCLIKTQLYL